MGPMDPIHACLLEVLSTRGLPTMRPILMYEKNPWQKYETPFGALCLFLPFYLPQSLLVLSYWLSGFVWCLYSS